MRKLAVASALAVLAAATVGAPATARGGHRSVVLCRSGSLSRIDYRAKPRSCVLHERHRPLAEAWLVRLKRMHWSRWSHNRAAGRGHAIAGMVGRTPVKVRLYRARNRCGHRVFSRAHVAYTALHSSGRLTLDVCR